MERVYESAHWTHSHRICGAVALDSRRVLQVAAMAGKRDRQSARAVLAVRLWGWIARAARAWWEREV